MIPIQPYHIPGEVSVTLLPAVAVQHSPCPLSYCHICGWQGNYSKRASKPYYEPSKNAIYRAGWRLGGSLLGWAPLQVTRGDGGPAPAVFVKYAVFSKVLGDSFRMVHILRVTESAGPVNELMKRVIRRLNRKGSAFYWTICLSI